MTQPTPEQISKLVRKWKRQSSEYNKAVDLNWTHGARMASRRYEGISIGLRWCYEDLEKLLKP